MKQWLNRILCCHHWKVTNRIPLVLTSTNEIVGVIIEETCQKCEAEKLRIAI